MIHFVCPRCNQKCQVQDALAGKAVCCPACNAVSTMPAPGAVAAPRTKSAAPPPLPRPAAPPIAPASRKPLWIAAAVAVGLLLFGLILWLALRNPGSGEPASGWTRTAFEQEFMGTAAAEVRRRLGAPAHIETGEGDSQYWTYDGLTSQPSGVPDRGVQLWLKGGRVVRIYFMEPLPKRK